MQNFIKRRRYLLSDSQFILEAKICDVLWNNMASLRHMAEGIRISRFFDMFDRCTEGIDVWNPRSFYVLILSKFMGS